MRIRIAAVGKVKNSAAKELIDDYAGRLKHYCSLDIVEVKDSNPAEEGRRLLEKCETKNGSIFIIALSEEGKNYSSGELAAALGRLNKDAAFLIGGPYGLSEEVKKKANLVLSLSRMTFTHEMARALLSEQVYRAFTILKGEKYHK
ncbi:MAG TPA: 23S rRNA (pseudouridine(1915)-N(3))-methyltransferase RlmH [Candidatus Nanoarchaeia archaeon]|nr:23S rRNA (pseudouridine(1915)-N(3))-methyltransferase RlmH [Candidatus Nanoarchaeia archaeon]